MPSLLKDIQNTIKKNLNEMLYDDLSQWASEISKVNIKSFKKDLLHQVNFESQKFDVWYF